MVNILIFLNILFAPNNPTNIYAAYLFLFPNIVCNIFSLIVFLLAICITTIGLLLCHDTCTLCSLLGRIMFNFYL
jgi:hypothetical protein